MSAWSRQRGKAVAFCGEAFPIEALPYTRFINCRRESILQVRISGCLRREVPWLTSDVSYTCQLFKAQVCSCSARLHFPFGVKSGGETDPNGQEAGKVLRHSNQSWCDQCSWFQTDPDPNAPLMCVKKIPTISSENNIPSKLKHHIQVQMNETQFRTLILTFRLCSVIWFRISTILNATAANCRPTCWTSNAIAGLFNTKCACERHLFVMS